MEIVLTPSIRWLEERAGACRRTFDVSSPFVTDALVALFQHSASKVEKTLTTRVKLPDFASGASRLESVADTARFATVRSLDRLHAKVYVFDEETALVTSANATHSGLRHNVECGLAIADAKVARTLAHQIRTGFAASPGPLHWTEPSLRNLVPAVDRLRRAFPAITQFPAPDTDEPPEFELTAAEAGSLLDTNSGWANLVYQAVLTLPAQFKLSEVTSAALPLARHAYPRNRHPEAKVRQQLQVLRDLGLLLFLGHGAYRRLIRTAR